MKKLICLMFIVLCVSTGTAHADPMLAGTANFSDINADSPWSATVLWEVYAPNTANPYGLSSGNYYSYFYNITNNADSQDNLSDFFVSSPYNFPLLSIGYLPDGGIQPVDLGNEWGLRYIFVDGSNNAITPGASSDWLYGTSIYSPTIEFATLTTEEQGSTGVDYLGSPGGDPLSDPGNQAVPEPVTIVLVGMGLIGGAVARRKKSPRHQVTSHR